MQEKIPELVINGKNTMPVSDIDQFKGHEGSALHGVEIPTGRIETAVTPERNKFKFAAVRTAIHGTAEGRIAAVDHFIHVFNNRLAWM